MGIFERTPAIVTGVRTKNVQPYGVGDKKLLVN